MKKVLIAKPCAQPLANMPRVPGGIFCTVCKAKVEDVSSFSADELQSWLKKNENLPERPCAVYSQEQARTPFSQKMLFPFRYAAITIASAFIAREGYCQQGISLPPDTVLRTPAAVTDTIGKIITGKVILGKDKTPGKPVTICVAVSDNEIITAYSAPDGSFTILLPDALNTPVTLTFIHKGYVTTSVADYVPCDKLLVLHLKKQSWRMKRNMRRRIVSKF